MNLIEFLRGLSPGAKKRPPNTPVSRDDEGEVLYADDIISHITQELERRRGERAGYELQWSLSANFLAGHQNCDIDLASNSIVDEDRVEKRDRERRVYNHIAPLMETREANLGSVKYDMAVKPRTSEPEDIAKAAVSTKLLQYLQANVDFQHKMATVRRWSEVCGTAFTLSWWNKDAGEVIGYELMETPQPDGTVKQVKREIRQGEMDMGLLTAYEVFPHSLVVEDIRDQHDIITEQVLDVGEIYDRYGVKVDGEQAESYALSPLPDAVTGHGRSNAAFGVNKVTREDCAKVITYYENPSKPHPRGRLIIIVKDVIAFYGELPGGVMPIQAVKAKVQTGLFFGRSVIQDLIPLQRTLNNVRNKTMDHIATVANNIWLVPEGSTDVAAMDMEGIEPGSVIIWNPERGKPEIIPYPDPPAIMMQYADMIEKDMEYVAGVSQLMVYGAAASTSSGKALETRREIDQTRMSMTADNHREAVLGMAKIWLALNKEYSTGYRVMQISGREDQASVYTWSAEDINSYDVEYVAENELRNSPEQQKQAFMEAYQLGLFTDDNGRMSREFKRRAWEKFQLGSLDEAMELDDMQAQNARRENAYLESGVIPKRFKYDDDRVHLEEHIKYALSADYRLLMHRAPEYAALFDQHIEEHRAVIQQKEQAAQMQAMAMQAAENNSKGGQQ